MTSSLSREAMDAAWKAWRNLSSDVPYPPALEAAITAYLSATGWRTIDSAPTESRILVWGGAAIRFGIKDKHGNWRATFHGPIKVKPTLWQPMPAPPSPTGKEE